MHIAFILITFVIAMYVTLFSMYSTFGLAVRALYNKDREGYHAETLYSGWEPLLIAVLWAVHYAVRIL